MFFNLGQTDHFGAVWTLDSERQDYFFDHARGSPNFDVFMTHGTLLILNEPILDAQSAEQFVAIVALFRLPRHLQTYLAQKEIGEWFVNFEHRDRFRIIPQIDRKLIGNSLFSTCHFQVFCVEIALHESYVICVEMGIADGGLRLLTAISLTIIEMSCQSVMIIIIIVGVGVRCKVIETTLILIHHCWVVGHVSLELLLDKTGRISAPSRS